MCVCNLRQYTKWTHPTTIIWARQDDLPRLLCLYYQRMQQLIPRVTLPPKRPLGVQPICGQYRKKETHCSLRAHGT